MGEGAARAADQGAARVPPSTRFQQPFGWRSALVLFVICASTVVAIFVFLGENKGKSDPTEVGSAKLFLHGVGPKDTEPFDLRRGIHRVSWRIPGPDCEYTATLNPHATQLFFASTSSTELSLVQGESAVMVEKSGEHLVQMATGPSCPWEIEISGG
jgi:hypothetical protein